MLAIARYTDCTFHSSLPPLPPLSPSISNTAVLIFKLIAYFYTGSAAMLSEAIHSLADILNQVMTSLLIIVSIKIYFFAYCSCCLLWEYPNQSEHLTPPTRMFEAPPTYIFSNYVADMGSHVLAMYMPSSVVWGSSL